jgi:hypothetical protein
MQLRAAVELKTLLVGVPLPAEKPGLLEYAVKKRAEPQSLDALQSLPDRRYDSLDEVLEDLVHTYTPSRRPARESRGTK